MSEPRHHCDRAAAREARNVVRNLLVPLAASLRANLAPTCPLSPEQDHLLPHEQAKHVVTHHQWRCSSCGKLFKSEHYLDMHLERKHPDLLNASASVCLGDFCDLLQCPSWVHGLREAARERPRPCKPSELEARQHACQHLMHDCFLGRDGSVDLHHVFEAMEERLCHPVSCAGRQQIVELGSLLAVPENVASDAGAPGWGYYTLGAGLIASLALLYLCMLVGYSETRQGDADLRALGGRRRRALWGGAKAKGY
jgi:hypothetical protein